VREAWSHLGLDEGVDDALGVDDHVNVVVGGAEEVVGLNHLQALVHHRGRVHGDLGAHVPVGVLERVGHRHLLEVLRVPVTEGTARGRQDDTAQATGGHTLHYRKKQTRAQRDVRNGESQRGWRTHAKEWNGYTTCQG
jgi:hypothetical protein